jgi:hypothetical protein
MRKIFPALAVLLGLGSSVSFAQAQQQADPFNRYLAGIKVNQPEVALVRFASECGVNVSNTSPRFAVGAGSSLTPVRNIAKGLGSLETDFYSTAEVWVGGDRVLLEFWANSDDVGSETRYLKCFSEGKLMQAEVIDWNVSVSQSPGIHAWGYSRRWERSTNGQLQRTKAEFVDEMERSIPRPMLDEEDKKSLLWIPPLGSIGELKLPQSMLR